MDTAQILMVILATPAVSVLLFLLRRLEDGLPAAGRDGEPAARARPQAALRTRQAYRTQLTYRAVPGPRPAAHLPAVSDGQLASGNGPPL